MNVLVCALRITDILRLYRILRIMKNYILVSKTFGTDMNKSIIIIFNLCSLKQLKLKF